MPIPDAQDVTPVPPEVILMLEQIDSSHHLSLYHKYAHGHEEIQFFHSMSFSPEQLAIKPSIRVPTFLSSNLPSEFQPFITKKDELSIVDNCLLWESRLVIPPTGRKLLLEELHEAHPGIFHMKSRARMLM